MTENTDNVVVASKPGYQYTLPQRRKDGNQICPTGNAFNVDFLETDANGDTVTEGTFTEDVLEMLIHRQQILHEKLPSRESAVAITKLEEALMWLGKRQADRKKRGVHMTHQA